MTNHERETIKACNIAGKTKPRPTSWGMFCYGDASPEIGGVWEDSFGLKPV